MAAVTSNQPGRTVRFTVTGDAIPKDRVRHRIVQPKGKRPFVQVYTPKETRDYELKVAARAKRAWGEAEPSMRPIELQVTVFVEIPTSWPKWKQEAATRGEILPTGTPDLDNVVKSLQDGMNGVIYRDDGQVATVDAVKLYAPQGVAGYVEVAIRENYRCASWISRLLDLVLLR